MLHLIEQVRVSIHAPHEGERLAGVGLTSTSDGFQSTLPTRGSDSGRPCRPDPRVVSIHAPHEGERPDRRKDKLRGQKVSIHAPHEGERRQRRGGAVIPPQRFNPRSPRGGATLQHRHAILRRTVSIHAPHEGERPEIAQVNGEGGGFNPRSPRGGATRTFWRAYRIQYGFQSTLPTRGSDNSIVQIIHIIQRFNPRSPRGGATDVKERSLIVDIVSIHAPHEGERLSAVSGTAYILACFNPRSPRGGATVRSFQRVGHKGQFQSTLPTRGSDLDYSGLIVPAGKFQSTLPTRGSDQ